LKERGSLRTETTRLPPRGMPVPGAVVVAAFPVVGVRDGPQATPRAVATIRAANRAHGTDRANEANRVDLHDRLVKCCPIGQKTSRLKTGPAPPSP
jgi:hypothetical protein